MNQWSLFPCGCECIFMSLLYHAFCSYMFCFQTCFFMYRVYVSILNVLSIQTKHLCLSKPRFCELSWMERIQAVGPEIYGGGLSTGEDATPPSNKGLIAGLIRGTNGYIVP